MLGLADAFGAAALILCYAGMYFIAYALLHGELLAAIGSVVVVAVVAGPVFLVGNIIGRWATRRKMAALYDLNPEPDRLVLTTRHPEKS